MLHHQRFTEHPQVMKKLLLLLVAVASAQEVQSTPDPKKNPQEKWANFFEKPQPTPTPTPDLHEDLRDHRLL